MSARPIDGAEGYRFFVQHEGEVELDEINEFLRGRGFREVKPRMLRHYQKLQKYGYSSYITQNRLDLAVAGDQSWLEELLGRYPEADRPSDVVLRWDGAESSGRSDAVGLASATADLDAVPKAGTSAVLVFSRSGIERLATVVRSDPASGRVHLRFDVFGGLPIAREDAPYRMRIRVKVPDEAESMPAIADLMLRIERAVARGQGEVDELPRVEALSVSSPLDMTLIASHPWLGAIGLLGAVPLLRRQWHQGTADKYRARQEKAAAEKALDEPHIPDASAIEREGDEALVAEIDRALDDLDGTVADGLTEELAEAGAQVAHETMSRRELLAAARAMVFLPMDLIARDEGDFDEDD